MFMASSHPNSNGNGLLNNIPTGLSLSVIGCGNMGSAILSRVMEACDRARDKGSEPPFRRFFATVNSENSCYNLLSRFSAYQSCFRAYRGENDLWMDASDVIILAFKTDLIDSVLSQKGVRDALAGKLVISVLVGASQQKLADAISKSESLSEDEKRSSVYSNITYVPSDTPPYIKRAMVNIAAEYGQAITVIESTPSHGINERFENITRWIFEQCGRTSFISPQTFDIGGMLSGASGALLSVALDGLLDGAVVQGLKRNQAKEIVTQSLISLATLLENGVHPAVLRENFSSPQGMTIAGLMSLEENHARWAFTKAAIATTERSRQIGQELELESKIYKNL